MYIDPFELLGVTIDSTPNDVRKAYYNLALIMHPDRGGNNADAHMLTMAYRWVYDQVSKVNRTKTVESLMESFENFCKLQKDDVLVPKFQDIFNDIVFDNTKFNNAYQSESIKGDLLAECGDGYGDIMDASSIVASNTYTPLVDHTVKNDFNAISHALDMYKEPVPNKDVYRNTCLMLWDDDPTKPKDLSIVEKPLVMTDYLRAFTNPDEKHGLIEIPTTTFDEIVEKRAQDLTAMLTKS